MKFNLFAASVHGKKYRQRGLPCQDFSATLEFGDVQAVALADGHGGKDYFRSDTGARLAVETAFEQTQIFCRDLSADETFSENGIRNFELSIVENWRKKVLADWNARLSTLENEPRWQTVSDKYKARFTDDDENIRARNIPVAYGTTLLCAISIGTQVLIAQIGDGTCVVMQRDGEFAVPVPPDKKNFANMTTSLCDEDAFGKFRHVVLNCDENSLAAIFLSTDGLDDCYPLFDNEKHLFKFYRETIVDGLTNDGFASTATDLREDILPYMTERGSNDDISLAWLVAENFPSTDTEEIPPAANEPQEISTPTISEQPKVQSPVNEPQTLTSPMVNPPPQRVPHVLKAANVTLLTTPTVIPINAAKEQTS